MGFEKLPSNKNNKKDAKHNTVKEDNYNHRRTYTFIALILICTLAASWVSDYLAFRHPEVLPASQVPLTQFSEERAKDHTRYLVEKIGMRLVGSKQNDIDSVNYLLNAINNIQTVPGGPIIEVSVQNSTGSLNMEWLHSPLTSIFSNVVNFVVRVRPSNSSNIVQSDSSKHYQPPLEIKKENYKHFLEYIKTTQKDNDVKSEVSVGYKERHEEYLRQNRTALLLSSHFDSTIGSPGACDDGVPVGVMLELIRTLASSKALPIPIIFNFNGGEEPGMQASFGFIAQHPWVKNIRAVINLEACGCGGREMLFQTGPGNGWLIDAYAKSVKFPYATVTAQDIFQKAKAVPGDTDFIVYRDLGDIPGLDFAFTYNGYVYHTSRDNMKSLDRAKGSVQNMGENVHNLINELAINYLGNPEHMKNLETESERVFFDLYGFFNIVYSYEFAMKMYVGYAILVFTIFCSQLFSLDKKALSKFEYLHALFFTGIGKAASFVSALLAGGLFGGFVSLILDKKMSWYTQSWFGIVLYAPPAIAAIALSQSFYRHKLRNILPMSTLSHKLKDNIISSLNFWTTQLVLCSIMIALTYIRFGSGYVLFVYAVVSSCVRFIIVPVARFITRTILGKNNFSTLIGDLLEIITLVIPLTTEVYNYRKLYTFYVPIMGRSGTVIEVDILIGVMVGAISAFAVLLTLLPTMIKYTEMKKIARFFIYCSFFVVVGLMVSPQLGNIYKEIQEGNASTLTMAKVFNPPSDVSIDPLHSYSDDTPKRVFIQQSHILDEKANIQESYTLGLRFDTGAIEPLFKHVPYETALPEVVSHDVETYYPFGEFIKYGNVMLDRKVFNESSSRTQSHIVPTLDNLHDSLTFETNANNSVIVKRKLTLKMYTGGPVCWANLRIKADHIINWSLTDSLPRQTPVGYFMVRKIGNGAHDIDFEFERILVGEEKENFLKNKDDKNVRENVFGRFPLQMNSACYYLPSEFLENLAATLPSFVDVFQYQTFIIHREF